MLFSNFYIEIIIVFQVFSTPLPLLDDRVIFSKPDDGGYTKNARLIVA